MIEDIKLNISGKVRVLREIKGVSQEALAALGISQQAYQKIECGETRISLIRAVKISKYLDLDFDTFFNFSASGYLNQNGGHETSLRNSTICEELIENLKHQNSHLTEEVRFLRGELKKKNAGYDLLTNEHFKNQHE